MSLGNLRSLDGLTVERLREVISYNPLTGDFHWTQDRYANKVKGRKIGYRQSSGHLRICVFNHRCVSNVLAWFYMTGTWPDGEVDHKDGDPTNDKWDNLRLATKQQNCRNRGRRSDNKSGYKGVGFVKGRWRARIMSDTKRIWLGDFKTLPEAVDAYAAAAKQIHGDFARIA